MKTRVGGTGRNSSQNEFARYAEQYERWYYEHKAIRESEVLAIKALKLRGLGLDIGVGSGALSSWIEGIVGTDRSLPMLMIARRRDVQAVQATGEQLPFKAEVFDYVLMTVTFSFLDNPREVLDEARRVLRAEGHLAVCIVARDSSWGKLYMKKASLGHRFYRFAKLYTFSELSSILEERGFYKVSVKSTLGYPPEAEHEVQEPTENVEGKGFVCVKCAKRAVVSAS